MLHLDVFKQRIKDEFGINVIITTPSVTYECVLRNGDVVKVENPVDSPLSEKVDHWKEAICDATIMTPLEHL